MDSGLSIPSDRELQIIAASVGALLESVPDGVLDECYLRARRAADPVRPFQWQAVYQVWLVMVESGEWASRQTLLPEVACTCVDGWIIVNKDGKRPYGDEEGFARRCDHNVKLESLPLASDEAAQIATEQVKQGLANLKAAMTRH